MPTATSTVEPEDDKPLAVVRASDIEKCGSQVAILCQIIEEIGPWCREHLESGCVVNCTPGTQEEATKTFELANIRLRDIIDDSRRWDLVPTGAEKASADVLEVYKQKAIAQTALVNALLAPHKRLNARIQLFPGTGWVAWVGGPLPYKHDLNGVGNTPSQAFAAFDRAYTEQAPLIEAMPPPPEPAPKARRGILRGKKK